MGSRRATATLTGAVQPGETGIFDRMDELMTELQALKRVIIDQHANTTVKLSLLTAQIMELKTQGVATVGTVATTTKGTVAREKKWTGALQSARHLYRDRMVNNPEYRGTVQQNYNSEEEYRKLALAQAWGEYPKLPQEEKERYKAEVLKERNASVAVPNSTTTTVATPARRRGPMVQQPLPVQLDEEETPLA